jgi:hypothetical protein
MAPMVLSLKKLKDSFATLSNGNKLIAYFFILLFIIWAIFDPIKYIWANDPFQKVILAPLGEEPFKLLLAFLLCSAVIVGGHLPQTVFSITKKPIKIRQRRSRNLSFSDVFLYGFVPLSIVTAVVFGYGEGSSTNIVLHVSMSSLGAVLIVTTYRIVKKMNWKMRNKVASMISMFSVPMLLHSVSNQYANIGIANHDQKYGYLVGIGRFLQDHTVLSSQAVYASVLLIIACEVLSIWIILNIVIPLRQKGLGRYNKI